MPDCDRDPHATARHLKARSDHATVILLAVVAVLAIGLPLVLVVLGLLTQGGPA